MIKRIKDIVTGTWFKFTRVDEKNKQPTIYEHTTKVVLIALNSITFISILVSLPLIITKVLPTDTFVILIALFVFFTGGMLLSYYGFWKISGYIPPLLIYLSAVYGNYIGGVSAPAMLLYVLAILMVSLLQGHIKQWIALFICIITYVCLGFAHHYELITQIRTDETAFYNRLTIVIVSFTGISVLIRFLIIQYTNSLNKLYRHSQRLNSLVENNLRLYERAKKEIEERKVIERELKIAKEKAEESNRLKTEFLANVSHELRTPMNSILGYAQLIQTFDYSKEDIKKYINFITRASKSLLGIINDIISVSTIESGKMNISPSYFSLHELMNEITEYMSYTIKNRSIKFEIIISQNVPDKIYTDRLRLKQILTNLTHNAFKFTGEGSITIEVNPYLDKKKPTRKKLIFSVEDTGIGIEEEKQNIIFEAFVQADGSASREYMGTGLGLSISKKLAEALGGMMWLYSEYGKGSTFYFTIEI